SGTPSGTSRVAAGPGRATAPGPAGPGGTGALTPGGDGPSAALSAGDWARPWVARLGASTSIRARAQSREVRDRGALGWSCAGTRNIVPSPRTQPILP